MDAHPGLEVFTQVLYQIVLQPFTYIAAVLLLWIYASQVNRQRKLFHSRMHSSLSIAVNHAVWGAVAGLVVSAAMGFLGTALSLPVVAAVWGIALLLALFKIRYLCLAYAAGLAILLYGLLDGVSGALALPLFQDVLTSFRLHVPSLLVLVGLLHLWEGALYRIRGTKTAAPQIYKSKRGKWIGGYLLQGYWPLPLFLLVPASNGGFQLPWDPLFFLGQASEGWSILFFPAMIGMSEVTVRQWPSEKIRRSSLFLVIFGMLLALCGGLAHWSAAVGFVGALLCLIGHEIIERFEMLRGFPQRFKFVQGKKGLKVLAVIPKSPAAEMGVLPGETVLRVNGVSVNTKAEFHKALRLNPAFCRLEVSNLQGENKFLQRALYAGDHHQLGLLFVPAEGDENHADYGPVSLPGLIGRGQVRPKPAVLAESKVLADMPVETRADAGAAEPRS